MQVSDYVLQWLIQDFLTIILLYTGDAIDSAAPKDAPCKSWIDDSADVTNYPTITQRFFIVMAAKFNYLAIGFLLSILLIVVTSLTTCCCIYQRCIKKPKVQKQKAD